MTFREAVLIAAIFEFAGAFLAGANVTDTMRKGIIDPAAFELLPHGAELFAIGMLASLISAAVWIHIAAFLGWPVSTTHSIVGAITGFGVAVLGVSAIEWVNLATIAASWLTSPLAGGVLAFCIFTAIRKLIFDARDPVGAAKRWSPVFAFPVFGVLALMLVFKGFKNLYDKEIGEYVFARGADGAAMISFGTHGAWVAAFLVGALSTVAMWGLVRRIGRSREADSPQERREAHASVERIFRYLQVITACFVAFAHGSNDVANSIGPLAAIAGLFHPDTLEFTGVIGAKAIVPPWVLLLGGVGIVVGLATFGWKVIETVGTKITEITPSRGFAAEFGAASTILVGSQLGMPLSTTHTIVGAVIGVGFARGVNALNLRIVLSIVQSWIYTIPFTAALSMALFYLLRALFV